MSHLLQWLRANDLPNWIATILGFAISAVASLFTYWFQKRRSRNAPNLEVCLEPGEGTISGEKSPLLSFKFINKTGKTVYLKNPSLRHCTKSLPLHERTREDSATGSCELKFRNHHTGYFELRHYILQTDDECETAIYLTERPRSDLLHAKAPTWRRIFRRPLFFTLEYLAMVGDRTYRVRTVV